MSEVTPEQPVPDPIDPVVLFALPARHAGGCCPCCAGYCPQDDEPDEPQWQPLISYVGDGVAYLGDLHLMVRDDVLGPIPQHVLDDLVRPVKTDSASWMVVPDEQPPLSTARQSVANLDRIDRAGLTVHERAEDHVILHLYRGAEHVGWTTRAHGETSIPPDQLGRIRAFAERAGVELHEARVLLAAARDLLSAPWPKPFPRQSATSGVTPGGKF